MLRNLHASFQQLCYILPDKPCKNIQCTKNKSYFYSVLPLKHNFIYFWLCWVFIAVWAFLSRSEQGLLQLQCTGFCCGARALQCVSFRSCGSPTQEHRFNSCGAWAQLPRRVSSFWMKDQIHVSCTGRWILYH